MLYSSNQTKSAPKAWWLRAASNHCTDLMTRRLYAAPLVVWWTPTSRLGLDHRPRTSATVPAEWCRIAATYHSLNGLIISANPASSTRPPLHFCQVTGQLMAEKLRYLSSFSQAPSHATAQPMRRRRKKKESVSSDVKSFSFYRAIRGFITAEWCQDSLWLGNG